MTPVRLAQIEVTIAELAAARSATTPGPWTTTWEPPYDREVCGPRGRVVCYLSPGWSPGEEVQARRDAEFVCLARNHEVEGEVRTLADVIRRLWARLGIEGGMP